MVILFTNKETFNTAASLPKGGFPSKFTPESDFAKNLSATLRPGYELNINIHYSTQRKTEQVPGEGFFCLIRT